MGMLKGNSTLNFEQLMAQATQVALKQDASLMERARQKRKEQEEKRRREEKAERERQENQAILNKKREQQEKKQKLQLEQNKKQRELERKRSQLNKSTKSKPSNNAFNKKPTSISSLLPEKKKPVHMSFEDLMKKAKEQSTAKTEGKSTSPTTTRKPSNDSNTPSLYHPPKRHDLPKPSTSTEHNSIPVRERMRLLAAEPPQKVNSQKRDRRSILEIQRDIRREKGNKIDDVDTRSSKDPRLMSNKNRAAPVKQPIRKRPLSPPRPVSKRPLSPPRPKKSLSPPPSRPVARRPSSSDKRPPPQAPLRRMPFSGKPLDRNSRPVPKRRYRDEEEEDEDLADFVVDDEDDDDPRYSRGPSRNNYSEEISKLFRYNRNKYANEPVYSDDDMEADASDVLREEKRSERIARREDYLEEQKELERLERLKKKRKTQ